MMLRIILFSIFPLLLSLLSWAQQPGPQDMPQEMVWVDRTGKILGRVGEEQAAMFYPRFSPDGRFIAVSARAGDGSQGGRNIWIHDVERGTKKQVTHASGNNNFPVWSPDGKKIAFNSSRSGTYQLYVIDLESGAERMILETDKREFPNDWSPDGRFLCYTQDQGATDPVHHLFLLSMTENAPPTALIKKGQTWFDSAVYSPDGRYLAYTSNLSGAWEVYIAPVQDTARSLQVSRGLSTGWAGGGGQPRWRGDGRELFYIMGNDTVMSVEMAAGDLMPATAKKLFSLPAMRGNFPDETPWRQKYDVTRDGQRFVFVRTIPRP